MPIHAHEGIDPGQLLGVPEGTRTTSTADAPTIAYGYRRQLLPIAWRVRAADSDRHRASAIVSQPFSLDGHEPLGDRITVANARGHTRVAEPRITYHKADKDFEIVWTRRSRSGGCPAAQIYRSTLTVPWRASDTEKLSDPTDPSRWPPDANGCRPFPHRPTLAPSERVLYLWERAPYALGAAR